MNAIYILGNTPAYANQSSLTDRPPKGKQPISGISTIWIVMATVLFSTIVITLGASIGIKIYFKRLSENGHKEEYFNGLLMTTAVYMAIPKICVINEYQVKTLLVLTKIVSQVTN